MSAGSRRAAAAALLSCAMGAVAVLAGCAGTPPAGALSGRLSVRADADGGRAALSVSAGFELQGDAERGALQLTSPLGTVVASARWSPGEAVLVQPSGAQRFDDLDALAREALGLAPGQTLPLRALPDWLRGRPWAGAGSRGTDGGFEQLGWRVDTARLGEGWLLAERLSAPLLQLRARLEAAP